MPNTWPVWCRPPRIPPDRRRPPPTPTRSLSPTARSQANPRSQIMHLSRQLAVCLSTAILSLGLGACAAPPASTPKPTAAAPVAPTTAPVAVAPTPVPVRPTVAVAATPTFERVRQAEPTVGVAQPHGLLSWRDDVQNNDGLQITIEELPALASNLVYAAWLQGKDTSLFLGVLR